jgi:hypothetical protein
MTAIIVMKIIASALFTSLTPLGRRKNFDFLLDERGGETLGEHKSTDVQLQAMCVAVKVHGKIENNRILIIH